MVLVAALAVTVLARMPRRAPSASPAPAARPVAGLALTWDGAALAPEISSVPKEHQVELQVTNAAADTLELALEGYADRLPSMRVAPGATWNGTFVADRPGDAFAWNANGRPVGRLAVTGSHLEEGHR
jgi:hypothetical protein